MDISEPSRTALLWAADANNFICTTVLKDGVDVVDDVDLGGAYYEAASPIVQQQLAKGKRSMLFQLTKDKIADIACFLDCLAAGYRLAAWLNLIATGMTSL